MSIFHNFRVQLHIHANNNLITEQIGFVKVFIRKELLDLMAEEPLFFHLMLFQMMLADYFSIIRNKW